MAREMLRFGYGGARRRLKNIRENINAGLKAARGKTALTGQSG
jgi:hypothetical protein